MSSSKKDFDQDFENLVKEFFEYYVEKFPEAATAIGLHQYDHLLSDISRTAFLQNIREFKSFKKKIEAIDPQSFPLRIALIGIFYSIFWIIGCLR